MNLTGNIKKAKLVIKVGKILWNIIVVVMAVVVLFQGVVWVYGKVKSFPANVKQWAYSDVQTGLPPQTVAIVSAPTAPTVTPAPLVSTPTASIGTSRSIEALKVFSQTIGSTDPATIKTFNSGGKEFKNFSEWFSYWTGNVNLVKMADALVRHDWLTASLEAASATKNEPALDSLPILVVEKLRSQEEIWARAKAKKEPTPSSFEIAAPSSSISFSAVNQAKKVQEDLLTNLTPVPTLKGPIDLVLDSVRNNEITKVETAGSDGVVITTKKNTQLLQKGKEILVVPGKGKPTIVYCIDCGDIKIAAVPVARATPDPTRVACLNDINCDPNSLNK